MNSKERKVMGRKKDILLILLFLLVGGGLLVFTYLRQTGQNVVEVRVDGSVVEQFQLDESLTYTIEGVGGSNLMRIEDGAVWLEDADCPDKICVHTGKIKLAGQSIVCLPHRVVVEIKEVQNGE